MSTNIRCSGIKALYTTCFGPMKTKRNSGSTATLMGRLSVGITGSLSLWEREPVFYGSDG